jgi:hypothetical protein
MYGVGRDYLGQADRLPLVEHIGDVESWVALAVWTLTFAAMPDSADAPAAGGGVTTLSRQVAPAARTSNCPDS